jgi:multidrug efflux pump subunit AcrB
MLIRNGVVLIDQIDVEIESGKDRYQSIVDSGVMRMRPVLMTAGTTSLGMTPLLKDAFFRDMAITIMAGLVFATILTLIVVPVLYSIFFGIKPREEK